MSIVPDIKTRSLRRVRNRNTAHALGEAAASRQTAWRRGRRCPRSAALDRGALIVNGVIAILISTYRSPPS